MTPRSWAALGLLLACATPLALAGPPFNTDDPEPTPLHQWEVNDALMATRGAGSSHGFLPSADINYGAAPGVQLHLQPQLAYATSTGSARSYGLGDTELGVKYRLNRDSDDPSDWMLSTYPLLELPTGNAQRNLGAGRPSLYLPLWLQTTRERWTLYGGGGYWMRQAAGQQNGWAGGVVALYQISENLQWGGELYGQTADTVGGGGSNGFNLGGNCQISPGISLLFSAGRGLGQGLAVNHFSTYLGVQVLTRPDPR